MKKTTTMTTLLIALALAAPAGATDWQLTGVITFKTPPPPPGSPEGYVVGFVRPHPETGEPNFITWFCDPGQHVVPACAALRLGDTVSASGLLVVDHPQYYPRLTARSVEVVVAANGFEDGTTGGW